MKKSRKRSNRKSNTSGRRKKSKRKQRKHMLSCSNFENEKKCNFNTRKYNMPGSSDMLDRYNTQPKLKRSNSVEPYNKFTLRQMKNNLTIQRKKNIENAKQLKELILENTLLKKNLSHCNAEYEILLELLNNILRNSKKFNYLKYTLK